jgi:hypothetical protein
MNPDIYYYNPTCELAVANGSEYFQIPALLRKFEYDLDILPAFFARPNDITLVHKIPSPQFLDSLVKAGFEISCLRLLEESLKDPSFIDSPKGFLTPWGWSPVVHKLLASLKPSCGPEFKNSPVTQWNPVHKELYSRKKGLELLCTVITDSCCDWMPFFEDLPQICTTHEEIILLQNKWGRIVVKSPWSSSGRGLQVLRKGEYNQTNRQVISGFFNQQGYVIAGPWHNKLIDMSLQFFSDGKGRVEYKGLSSFITDKSGRYAGSYIEEIPKELDIDVKYFLEGHLEVVRDLIFKSLTDSLYSTRYCGWIGVDSIVYKSENGQLMIHPCIEVNCRYTMGAIALVIRNHLAEGSRGMLRTTYCKEGHFAGFCKEMEAREPLIMRNGKIISGFLSLTPTSIDSQFGAYLNVYDH